MQTQRIVIATVDGPCPAIVVRPEGTEPLPAVILFMDAGGIRPAVEGMAERLASAGYVVLLPDLFHRFGPYGPLVPSEVLAGDAAAVLGPLMATTGNAVAAADTDAFIDYLDSRPDVTGRLGAVGFCMGGGMALTAATTYPDRFAAVASFHGGNLATDAPDSPHLLAGNLKAEVYIAAAEDDNLYPPAMAERLEKTLDAAGVTYLAETYPAAHGWMKPDFPTFDPAAAERGWKEMLALFGRVLR